MRLLIEKLIQGIFLSPLAWAFWCLIVSYGLIIKNRVKPARRFLLAGIAVLFLFASYPVATLLGRHLEYEFPLRTPEEYPKAAAIVALGGTVAGPYPPRLTIEETRGARVLMAARLYKAKKAPIIFVTSGVPYKSTLGEVRTEADDMHDLLIEYGVPASAVVVENRAATTADNAVFTAALLKERGVHSLLLVTSAYHVGRATKLFRRQGFEVTAVPSSHEVVTGWPFDSIAPSAGSLEKSSRFLKEYFGRWVGR